MKLIPAPSFFLLTLTCALFFGCAEKRLEGLAPDQIPAAIAKAFEKADPGLRMQAEMIATACKGNQWMAATTTLNELLAFPSLTAEQRRVLSQAQITVAERMREMAGEPVPANAPTKTARKTGEPPAAPAAPEEQAAAKAALRIYQQSK